MPLIIMIDYMTHPLFGLLLIIATGDGGNKTLDIAERKQLRVSLAFIGDQL